MRGNGIIIHGGIVIFGAQGKQVGCLREPVAVCVEPRAIYVTGSLPKKGHIGEDGAGRLRREPEDLARKRRFAAKKAHSALPAQAAERADTKKELYMDKKTKKLVIIGVVVLAVLVCAFLAIWFATRPETSKGAKTVNVTVDFGDGETKNYELHTDAEYLRGALDEENLVEGTESEFGLYVLTVDGVTADESKQQWWCFTKGGEMLMTGVDTTPIEDGDSFEITLTTGW